MKTCIYPSAIRKVRITDPLFGHYAQLVAEKVLPYQWEILNDRVADAERSYCIANFRIAAGELEGQRQGVVFCDTDAYKWLEAVAYCIENGSGTEFEATADQLIDLIARAQQPDGYLNTYYTVLHPEQRWTNLTEGHELYGAGHLIEAAVAYYSATGKEKLLDVARRFADLICSVFGPDGKYSEGCPGHQEIELALVRLWQTTGERRYLEQAERFVSVRGREPNYLIEELKGNRDRRLFPEFCDYDAEYAQSHALACEQTQAVGHSVRAMYYYSAMTDLARELGSEEMKNACGVLWENTTNRRMYITGGIGSSGHLERFTTDYDLPNDRTYCESCASVGLMMFGRRMAELTRDARYHEHVERALCNTVLAGISMTGDRYFYVNPLEVWPENCISGTSMAHVKAQRQRWYSVACCPTNIARTLASLGQYIYAEDNRSVYINQPISSELDTTLGGVEVSVRTRSTLLRDGRIAITVNMAESHSFTLRVRVPAYLREPQFTLDGQVIHPLIEKGYAVLAVSRKGTQIFEISGSVKPEFVAANTNVRADIGRVALTFGPYVYCLEQQDNGTNLAARLVSSDAQITVAAHADGLPGDLPQLLVDGVTVAASIADESRLYGKPQLELKQSRLTATPYCLWGNRTPGEMIVWMHQLIHYSVAGSC